jgi:hypothetical protein
MPFYILYIGLKRLEDFSNIFKLLLIVFYKSVVTKLLLVIFIIEPYRKYYGGLVNRLGI